MQRDTSRWTPEITIRPIRCSKLPRRLSLMPSHSRFKHNKWDQRFHDDEARVRLHSPRKPDIWLEKQHVLSRICMQYVGRNRILHVVRILHACHFVWSSRLEVGVSCAFLIFTSNSYTFRSSFGLVFCGCGPSHGIAMHFRQLCLCCFAALFINATLGSSVLPGMYTLPAYRE